MKAFSLWQPWASLMAEELKHVETREWGTPYRGWLAIHAARHFTGDLLDFTFHTPAIRDFLSDTREWENRPLVRDAFADTRGRVVALGRLADCVPTTAVRFGRFEIGAPDRIGGRWQIAARENRYGDFTPGRVAWVFDEIVSIPAALRPRVTGERGLFEWAPPPAIAALVPGRAAARTGGA